MSPADRGFHLQLIYVENIKIGMLFDDNNPARVL